MSNSRSLSSGCQRATRLLLIVAAVGFASRAYAQAPPPPVVNKGPTAKGQSPGWKQVDRLVGEQKLAEAVRAVEAIRVAARASGNDDELVRALVKEVQLRIALGGYETAVRFLRDEKWPAG